MGAERRSTWRPRSFAASATRSLTRSPASSPPSPRVRSHRRRRPRSCGSASAGWPAGARRGARPLARGGGAFPRPLAPERPPPFPGYITSAAPIGASPISLRPPSTRTWARASSRRWRPRSRPRRWRGSPSSSAIRPRAAGCSSAAATWRTSSACSRRGRRACRGTCAPAGCLPPDRRAVRIYASSETHTWLQKAADLIGLGTDSISWIPTDRELRIDLDALRIGLREDEQAGALLLALVGTAGTVSTGAVDPLPELAALARERGCGCTSTPPTGVRRRRSRRASLTSRRSKPTSVAVDPHKWLYTLLEAGCALVRDRALLRDTFSYHPPYYRFGEEGDEGLPQLPGVRAAEFARLPGAEGLARPPAGGQERLRGHDRGRHRTRARPLPARRDRSRPSTRGRRRSASPRSGTARAISPVPAPPPTPTLTS